MKIITNGRTRNEAVDRMRRALNEIEINGLKTNIKFCQKLLENGNFLKGNVSTDFVKKELKGGLK
jgi:acetyl/propionyl-CoA carboxylase alpha subunit